MKYLLIISTSLLMIACGGEEEKKEDNIHIETTVEDTPQEDTATLTVQDTLSKPGETVEYFPNGQVKTRGKLNENGNREGLWVAYYDNGIKWSESYYVDGVLDGHSLTFYPNGGPRYVGEYDMGERFGTWKFYDEEGNITKEEKF
jgi:antitoxin component YwqK of YwqJK toxin-antitoxin module